MKWFVCSLSLIIAEISVLMYEVVCSLSLIIVEISVLMYEVVCSLSLIIVGDICIDV